MLRSHKIISSKRIQLKMLLILFLFSFSKSWGQINENIQSWTNQAAYGNYTQNITAGTVNMTQCIIQNAASSVASGCSIGRVQMNSSSGIIELPSLASVGICEFHIVAGGSGRSVKLQYNNAGTWTDLTTFTGIGTTCGTYTFNVNSCVATTLRLSSPSAAIYVHDIIVPLNASCSSCTPPTTTITPITQTVCAGAVTTISVSSSAASNTYTWQASATSGGVYSNVSNSTPAGTSYSGTNTAVLTLTAGATYYYRCLVTDVTGSCTATSGTSTLVVNTAPTITTQTTPSSTIVCAGTATSFSVGATGTILSYQWQVSTGGTFSNATGGAYTNETTNKLNIGTGQAVGAYTFQCIISNSCGTLTSTPVTLTVASIPAMPTTPTVITTCVPAVVSETVVGTPPAGVTWYWETSSTATSTTSPTSVDYTLAATANVFVRALNTSGCWNNTPTTSSVAVTVTKSPTITTQPSNTFVCQGNSTSTKVTMNGGTSTPVTYQWQENTGSGFVNINMVSPYSVTETPLTSALVIDNTKATGTYTYQCVISNSCGTVTTSIVTVTIAPVPAMPVTPTVITTCAPAVVSETVVGTPPAGVTWYWETSSTATSTLNPTSVDYTLAATANVFVRALHSGGCWNNTPTTSSVAVTVTKSPTIITQSSSSVVCQGTSASIKVTMNSGSSTPLTYQWQENTGSGFTNISNGSPYTISVGTYTSTLDIDGTKPVGTYTYQCVISNSCGTVTTSVVTVTISALPPNDLCSNAISLSDGTNTVGNLNCASATSPTLTNAASKNDVWYSFTPTCTASYTVTMTFSGSTTTNDLDLYMYNTTCPTSGSAAASSIGSTATETIIQTLTGGATYYFRITDFNTTGISFSVSVNGGGCLTPYTVTFDANGGSGSMSNQTASSATSLTSNAFTNSGCTFVNWNDSANANGTSYSNNAIYSFTADVTLYAQWNCSSGGGSAGCPYLVSAVVNACSGSCNAEGKNEIVVMNSGNYSIPVNGSNINLYYSGGTNHYFTNSFAGVSQSTVVTNLNTLTATSGCTNTPFIFVPSGGTIPSNSNFMILNNNSCFNGDFSAYCNTGPIYVIISTDTDWFPGGYFGNNNTPRYFRTDFSNVNASCGLTTYNYNNPSTFGFGNDGASVVFNGTTPSYITGNGTCAPSIAILPIELIDFYATQDGAKNNLTWKVASEIDVLQYIIEKSDDGVNFVELSRVNTNHIENAYQIYQSEDNSPNSGITYYRLSTLESSNNINHYKIIDIDRSNKDWKSLLYQNDDELILEFKNAIPKNAQLLLFDLSGKLLSETFVEQSSTRVSTISLATGIYFVKIESPYKIENFKIFIQNDK